MDNAEIIKIFKEEFDIKMLVDVIGTPILKVKDADILKKIDALLKYLDCDGYYKEDVRQGFRIFAKEFKMLLNNER